MNDDWRPVIITPEEAMALMARGEEPEGEEVVFVSLDMRLKDGLLADRDRRIFADMQAGKMIPLSEAPIGGPNIIDAEVQTPEEMTEELGNARAHAALRGLVKRQPAEEIVNLGAWMDDVAAGWVRRYRVEERGSWRYVAGKMAERFGTGWGEDQPTGMMLCEIAAKRFGEDYLEGEWN